MSTDQTLTARDGHATTNGHGNGAPAGNGNGNGNGNGPSVSDDAASLPLDPRAAASIDARLVEVAPGEVAHASLSVTNLRSEPCSFALTLSGLEPGWFGMPERIGPLAPGERADVPFHVSLPRGYPPCSLLLAVEARPLPAADDRVPRRVLPGTQSSSGGSANFVERRLPGRHDLQLRVGDGARVVARVDPEDVTGGWHGRFSVFLRNRGSQSQQVHVDAVTPDPDLELRFDPDAPLLLPGHEVKVAAHVRTRRHLFGRHLFGEPRRRPFAVRVQGRGTAIMAEGSFTSHPLLPRWASKALIIVLVMALWAAVAVVGIRALSDHLHKSAVQQTTLAAPKSTPSTSTSTRSAQTPTSPTTSPSKGSSGSSSTSPSSKPSSPSSPSSSQSTVTVAGKVAGNQPGGVTVTLAPTSLVSTQVLGASGSPSGTLAAAQHHIGRNVTRGPAGVGEGPILTASVHRASRHARAPSTSATPELVRASHRITPIPDGKVYGTEATAAFFPGLTASVTPTLTTQTSPDGSYVFTGIPAPGTYLVSFTQPGNNTRKYVVQTSKGAAVSLNTTLTPGTGSLGGEVTGPSGPLGGVSVTVTDGSISLTTVTPTTGSDIGVWSVSGLNTPDTYSVSASASGYSTQSTTASLAASSSLAGVDLKLVPGVGSISGTVRAGTSGQPVGDITVTATNGSSTATATTSTVSPVGSYLLPNLTVPGTWTLTVSGSGWITQTQEVKLTGNTVVNAALTESGANVVGVVSSADSGLGNVGLTLSNSSDTFKALSATASPVGGFDFDQVPPGQYVLSATLFGYTTQSASISVTAGETKTVDLTLPYVGQSSMKTGTITGSVVNEFSGKGIATIPLDLDGKSTAKVTDATGLYTISDVAPGLHEVTALGKTRTTFATAGVQVSVAEGATVTASIIELPHLSKIEGTVTSQLTGKRVGGATVQLFAAGKLTTVITSTTTTTPAGTYTLKGVTAGSYVLEVKKTATGYNVAQVGLTVAAGETPVEQDVSLTEGPTYQAKTWYVTSTSGRLAPLAYACVLVTGPFSKSTTASTTKAMITSPTDNEVTFTGMKAGKTYDVTFVEPTPHPTTATQCPSPGASSGLKYKAPRATFTAKTDNTTIYGAVLAPVTEGITVHLEFPYVEKGSGSGTPGKTQDCPVTTVPPITPCSKAGLETATLPTVKLVGTTSYGTSVNGTPGTAVTSTVTMLHSPDTTTWTYTIAATSTHFFGTSVTVEVTDSAGQFQSLTASVPLSTSGSATKTELLTPVPVKATATISPTSGVSISVLPSKLQPTSKTGTANSLSATDTVAASEGSGGAVTWADTAVRSSGYAQPGTYKLTLSESGYVSKTVTLTVPLCPTKTSCETTFGAISLAQLVTLKVTPVSTTVPSTLTLPTVDLYLGTGTGDEVAHTNLVKTGSTYRATFTNALTPAESSPYHFTVSGPGIEQYTSPDLTLATAHTGILTAAPSLTETGWLTGTVTGILVPGSSETGASQALATATIAATLTGTAPAGCSATLSTHSGATGSYKLIPATGGLCPTATYTITVSAKGFVADHETVEVHAGDNDDATFSFTLNATKVEQKIYVKGVTSGVVVNVEATSTIGPTITCTFTVGTTTPKACTTASASTDGTTGGTKVTLFVFHIYPTLYSYSLTAHQYQEVTLPVPAPNPGTTPHTQRYTMSQPRVTIQGTVKVSATGTSSGAKAIATLPLTLYTSAGTSKIDLGTRPNPVTTNASGKYTFKTALPGDYLIKVGDNYTTTTASAVEISTGTKTLVVQTFTVYAPHKQVKIAVDGASATGTHVHLTPTTATLPECSGTNQLRATGLGTTQTATAGKVGTTTDAVFTDVVPDAYKLSVGKPTSTGLPSSTIGTIVVCPTASTATTAVTKPAAPMVTLPTVTLTASTSLTYGTETTKTFTVKVRGDKTQSTHGYPEGTVTLTKTGTSKRLTCTLTSNATTALSTFACKATSSKELGVGSYKVLFDPATQSSSKATYFYGPAKSETTVTVTASKPGAPTTLSESAKTSTTVTLSWTAPATTGGSSITGYVVLETESGYEQIATPTTTTYKVTGLMPGTTYKFKVEATNSTGTSTPSSALSVTTTTSVPAAPAEPSASSITKTSVTLSWTAPTTGGSSITGYVVLETEAGTFTAIATPTSTTHEVTGLTAGITYSFEVEATNAKGSSTPSSALSVKTTTAAVPAAPAEPSASSITKTSVTLSWTAPTTGGSSITGYVVLETEAGTFTAIATPTSTTHEVTGLTAGSTYSFEVEAKNAKGDSTPSPARSVKTTTASVPAAPAEPSASSITKTSVTLSWTAPTTGGSSITGYVVLETEAGTFTAIATPTTTTHEVTGLTAGITYSFEVEAKNGKGSSSPSAPVSVTTTTT